MLKEGIDGFVMGSSQSKAEHCFETGNEQLNRTRSPSFDSRLYEDDRNLEPWYKKQGTEQYRTHVPSISTDSYVREVRDVARNLSTVDRKIYNFARIKIAEEDLDKAEITIGFQHQHSIVFKGVNNPTEKVFIGLNFDGRPELVWRKKSVKRKVCGAVKKFFVWCFNTLKKVLLDILDKLLAIGPFLALPALMWL